MNAILLRSCFVLFVLSLYGSFLHAEDNQVQPDPVEAPESTLMLDLPETGMDPTAIDFQALPKIKGKHGVVSLGDEEWNFRLHNYLAFHDGKYFCFWSHGPVVEDKARQHLQYSTSLDGLNWEEPRVLLGPPKEGYGYIARGLWVRDNQLIALASLYEAPSFNGGDLELVASIWDIDKQSWSEPQLIFDDALNNFPPKKLATGEWMMSKRSAKRDVSILIGGVKAIDDWKEFPLSTYKADGGGKPEEPFWWKLPDDNLVGLFRDNSRSGRLLRAFSTDNGRSWTKMTKTNFPDATSKFHVTHTSNGYWVMFSNPNPKQRNPLCMSVSRDGLVFDRMVRLPVPEELENAKWADSSRFGSTRYESWQYPHSIEQNGSVLVAFSRRKQTVEVIQIDLDDIAGLYLD
ncbi:hypothetical protein Pla110_19270 [Polystyrenella longa]|uniref:Sialidase domain-containing protein n=1 Tax=Polystyrenella longa TaxID=2528007 RepID=A0A518CLX9_9PLAN|nr:exo-alpha-sialidase [Polystyrenella longa]QDU80203.1 hypothetical protein Pla110_19270 [Polystyrenella longa]